MYILVCYIGYLTISLIASVWVAQMLVRNGRAFLVDAFHGNVELADSVNHLRWWASISSMSDTLLGPCAPAPKSRRRAAR
jgi:hypothetical protein